MGFELGTLVSLKLELVADHNQTRRGEGEHVSPRLLHYVWTGPVLLFLLLSIFAVFSYHRWRGKDARTEKRWLGGVTQKGHARRKIWSTHMQDHTASLNHKARNASLHKEILKQVGISTLSTEKKRKCFVSMQHSEPQRSSNARDSCRFITVPRRMQMNPESSQMNQHGCDMIPPGIC